MRLINRPPKTLEEKYFCNVRPLLFERHGAHKQTGVRENRTLAEHLDSVCQFVLTVSRMANVPDIERGVILASAAVHDLNKLDSSHRSVKRLARDNVFLHRELESAGVNSLIPDESKLELARRLIERHSGHNISDGSIFLPEDERINRWASILRAADLFDLEIPDETLIQKIQTELVHALNRPSNLYRVRVSEHRGYLTALLLAACEEELINAGLTPVAIFLNGELFEGKCFPDSDVLKGIAKRWQLKIDTAFAGNLEKLVKPGNNGIRIVDEAVKHDSDKVVKIVMAWLEKKKSNFDLGKVEQDIEKHIKGKAKANPSMRQAWKEAQQIGLNPIHDAEGFYLSEGLKAAFISYGQAQPSMKNAKKRWERVFEHTGISKEKQAILKEFEPQYAIPLLAANAVVGGRESIKAALLDSINLRKLSSTTFVSQDMFDLTRQCLQLPKDKAAINFHELDNYIKATATQRCSLGVTGNNYENIKSAHMPLGTKVQVFSNRLAGGRESEPGRKAAPMTLLMYKLMSIGAQFPKKKDAPSLIYLSLSMPQGSCPELLRIWRECLRDLAAINTEGGLVSIDEDQLYADNFLEFKSEKGIGFAFPRRAEFVNATAVIPITFGKLNTSKTLLKSARLALELSLSLEIGFPFSLSSSLQIEPTNMVYGQVEGIPSPLFGLLGSGQYDRQQAIEVRDRLRHIGNISQTISGKKHRDDCIYDLARACCEPFSLYHVILRWVLREQQNPNLGEIWRKIHIPLESLLKNLMPKEKEQLTTHLRNAAAIAVKSNLRGRSFNRTSLTKPFTDFLKSVRSQKSYMDLDFLFASLSQDFLNHLDRIWNGHIGKTQRRQISDYYSILRQLYEDVYDGRPEKLMGDRKQLEAAYLFFWQEAYDKYKADHSNEEE